MKLSSASLRIHPRFIPLNEDISLVRVRLSRTAPLKVFTNLCCLIILLSGLNGVVFAQPKKKPESPPAKPVPFAEAEETQPEAPSDDETADLPKLDTMELPSFQSLMQGTPRDWIVLVNQKVLEVETLYPRPGTLDDLNTRIKGLMRKVGDPPESDAQRRRRLAMYNLPVTLLEGEEREYKLHIRFIKEIIYFDDLMLRRIDKLLDQKQVRQAYELLVALDERQPDWPGTAPRRDRLLYTEAFVQFEARQTERAIALLESLHERNAAYPGLDDALGSVFDRAMSDALQRDDPRQSRFFLKRLSRRIPAHKLIPVWTNRLIQQTRDRLAEAAVAERQGHTVVALDLVEQAARIWPELPEVLPVFNRLSNRHQRLRVGVVDLPAAESAAGSVVLPRSERRRRQLTETPLFQPARVSDKIARYQTRFFQDWEPAELGHSVVFRLQPFRRKSESLPTVTSAALAAALADRLEPANDAYDARFAAAVAGLQVRGPFELVVQFRQVPLRPEALFAFPFVRSTVVSPAESSLDPQGAADSFSAAQTYPFELQPFADKGRVVYRRAVAEPESATDRHVDEVVEVRYDTSEKAIQGLLRGEVSLLPRIPESTVKSFAARNEFFTQPYALPATHLLQFHPRSRPLQSRALRRGLIYALDRSRILEDVFLHEHPGGLGRLTTAPWPSTIYAYNRFIVPHDFDPALAFSLAKTAEKELSSDKTKPEKLPTLRLWIPDDPEVRQAATRIVEAWGKVGIRAELISPATGAPLPTVDSNHWDIAYRTEVVAEPLVELWPLLALTPSTETTTLGYLPTWLRHDLLELDRIGDWRSAEELLHKLHRQLWAEVHLIPLWELDEHFVVRKNIRNVPDRPLAPYQGIDRWKVEPWYSRD